MLAVLAGCAGPRPQITDPKSGIVLNAETKVPLSVEELWAKKFSSPWMNRVVQVLPLSDAYDGNGYITKVDFYAFDSDGDERLYSWKFRLKGDQILEWSELSSVKLR